MTIPVTILGGFLGAGKTTALNALLRAAQRRIAVLVNDFGTINIDAALIAERGADMIALSNGCVCCELGDDLGAGIAALIALQPRPEQIVVEASGVSDPWRIAQLVRLEVGVALDAVLVLADAARFPTLLADPWLADTLERQVARADLVLLSHTDHATESEITVTRAALRRLRPLVTVAMLRSDLLDVLLASPALRLEPTRLQADAPPSHGFLHWHWLPPRGFGGKALRDTINALPDAVLRAKGFVHIDGTSYLLQRVGRRTELSVWRGAPQSDALVLVGLPAMPSPETLTSLFATAMLPMTTPTATTEI